MKTFLWMALGGMGEMILLVTVALLTGHPLALGVPASIIGGAMVGLGIGLWLITLDVPANWR